MSNKLGRNTPCHCGSGKKYKKCCLTQDENIAKIEKDPDLLYEDIESDFSEIGEDDYDGESFENDFVIPDVEPRRKPTPVNLPEITAKEQELVQAWGEKYIEIDAPDEHIIHLKNFIQDHPSLVPHLYLDEEALFEIGASLLQNARGKEYIEILLDIRQNFLDVYMRSYSYYDKDLVVYHICQGEFEMAAQFINNFKAYPDDDPDMLYPLIDFLCVSNRPDLISELLRDNYLDIIYSNNIMSSGEIIDPFLWACFYVSELENGYDEKSINALSATLESLKIDFVDGYTQPEKITERLNFITEKIEKPFEEMFKASKIAMDFYYQISLNYIGWIHENKNIPWLTAYYYHTFILEYFKIAIPKNKRPKKSFVFVKSHFESMLVEMSLNVFGFEATKELSSLKAFSLFFDYLSAHQAISRNEAEELQDVCKVFHKKKLPELLESQFEAFYFCDDFEEK